MDLGILGSANRMPILCWKCKVSSNAGFMAWGSPRDRRQCSAAAAAAALLLVCYGCRAAAAAVAAVLRDYNPATLQLTVILGIDGNAQHATATARRSMRPSVLLLVVSPCLSTHCAGRGRNAPDRETVLTVRHKDIQTYIETDIYRDKQTHIETDIDRDRQTHRQTDIQTEDRERQTNSIQ